MMRLPKTKYVIAVFLWGVFLLWVFGLYTYEQRLRQKPLRDLPPCPLNCPLHHTSENLYFDKGWSYAEENFRWTDRTAAAIYFKLKKDRDYGSICLKMELPGANGPQRVVSFFNGHELGKFQFDSSPKTITYHIPGEMLSGNGINKIHFKIPDAKKPDNGDPRYLGFTFSTLYVNTNCH